MKQIVFSTVLHIYTYEENIVCIERKMPFSSNTRVPVDLENMNQHLLQMYNELVGMHLDDDPKKKSMLETDLNDEMIPRNMRERSAERKKEYGRPLPLTPFHYALLEAMRVPDRMIRTLIYNYDIGYKTNPFSKIVWSDDLAAVILSLRSEEAITQYLYDIYSKMYQYAINLIQRLMADQDSVNETRRLKREKERMTPQKRSYAGSDRYGW